MAVLSWVAGGNALSTSCEAKVELSSGSSARMVVSTSAGLSDPLFGPSVPVSGGRATLVSPALEPDTRYYLGVEVDGNVEEFTAKIWTDPVPGTRANTVIRAASCAGQTTPTPGVLGTELVPSRVSNSPNFVEFARAGGEFVRRQVHMGDWTYYNLGSGSYGVVGGASPTNINRMFSDFLRQPNQRVFWSSALSVLQTDDHELQNDHASDDPGLPNLRAGFSQRIPHSDLLVPGTLYREEMVGRVLCVYLDVRSGRTANDAPDGPGKTMLGTNQFDRFTSTLRSAGGNSMIDYVLVFSPSVWWQPSRLDGWDSFQWEQNEIIKVIHESNLTGKLDVICGDVHAIGIDSGGNSPGGIRTATFAAIDSGGGSSLSHNDLGPTSPGRRRWGTIGISYSSTRLEVTLTGWFGDVEVVSDTRTINLQSEPEPPPPDPDLPEESVASATPVVRWLVADLKTGNVLEWLPFNRGTVSRTLCDYTSDTVSVPMPLHGAASGLGRRIRKGRTAIVCLINNKPAWSGIPMKTISGHNIDMQLGCVSIEGYLWRLFVRDLYFENVDESAIVAGLLSSAAGANGIRLIMDCPPTGVRRTRRYFHTDNAYVGDRLKELSEVIDGPEWTIDTEWDVENERVVWVFRLRRRIGVTEPRVTLATDGPAAARWELTDDFAEGYGATHVLAYSSSGEGEARPESAPFVASALEADGFPRYEYRFSPSSSITDLETLNDHAESELRFTQNGTRSLKMTVRRNAEPGRWAVDWDMGDNLRFDLKGPLYPDGYQGAARCIGWKLDTTSEDIEIYNLLEQD